MSSSKGACHKWCCTYEGLNQLKKWVASCVGISIIIVAVVSLLNPARWAFVFDQIRMLWNIVFGTLMVSMQFGWEKKFLKSFGFLSGWFGRGMFNLFVGTNVMCGELDECWWTWIVGSAAIFVGAVELIFGFRCKEPAGDAGTTDPSQTRAQVGDTGTSGGGGGGFSNIFGGGKKNTQEINQATEPTFSISVTPSQMAQGAQFAADNASTISKVAGSASNSADKPNPFFGNDHLK